jgi:phosphoribosylformimino-5-aminoimidazole carboxamide ribotide isomerase
VELIPAIDLRGGRVVRLRSGVFAEATIFGDDPVEMARRWVGEGATRLHVVDLDGAQQGRPVQAKLLAGIVAAAGVPVQVAGGLRDEVAVRDALTAGADRVVLGTALIADPAMAARLIARSGAERIVAALDVRGAEVVGEAWRPGAVGRPLFEVLSDLLAAGVQVFAVTAIERDGLLGGPDLDLYERTRAAAPGAHLIASGGIRGAEDLRALAGAGCDAAILGRALYEGQLTMADALRAVAT